MKDPEKQSSSATSDPKLEVQFSTEYSDYLGGRSVPYHDPDGVDYQDLKAELDEFLLFGLTAADLPLRADCDVYTADQYWDVDEAERDVTLHADPTGELLETEEDLARAQLARDDLTRNDRAVIRALADGGVMHYQQLAEESETSSSAVYRTIDKVGGLIDKVGTGQYDLADDVIRAKIEDVFSALEDVTEWVERGIESIVDRSEEIAQDSPLAKWARRHGAVLSESYDGLEVELTGPYPDEYELRKVLRAGYLTARDTGADTAARFFEGSFSWKLGSEHKEGQHPFTFLSGTRKVLGASLDA